MNQCHMVRDQLTNNQVFSLLEIFQNDTSWGGNRKLDELNMMLQNCRFVALINTEFPDEIVGFARYLSDSVYRAMIYDVVVAAKYRGQGFGRMLLCLLLKEEGLQSVERIELYARDEKVTFYEKFGFKEVGMNLMRKLGEKGA